MERGVIWAFWIVFESDKGLPLEVKKKDVGSRVWKEERRDVFNWRRV